MSKSQAPERTEIADRARVWLIGVTLIYGAIRQGAFYADQFVPFVFLISLTVVARALTNRPVSRVSSVVIGALVGLGLWAMVVEVLVGGNGIPTMAACFAIAGAYYASTGLTEQSRAMLFVVIMTVGGVVSLTSWVGVAWHHQPWAMPSQSLWRGASTLTYANAAAAFLFVPMLVTVERWLATSQRGYLYGLFALSVGWMATLSRASGTSLIIAMVVALVFMQRRRRLLSLWPVAVATFIATAALLPSLPEGDAAQPTVALAGIVVALIVQTVCLFTPRVVQIVAAALVVVGSVGAMLINDTAGDALTGIDNTRLDVQSSDRTDLMKVTWSQFADRPLTGVGPGQINFDYINSAGVEVEAEFTHNEYLQVAAELGIIGGLLAAVATIALALRSGLRQHRTDAAVLTLILVLSFAGHSLLDFLWHLPLLPVFASIGVNALADEAEVSTT